MTAELAHRSGWYPPGMVHGAIIGQSRKHYIVTFLSVIKSQSSESIFSNAQSLASSIEGKSLHLVEFLEAETSWPTVDICMLEARPSHLVR